MDEPMPGTQAAASTGAGVASDEPTVIISGSFRDADNFHRGSGRATIYRLPDGTQVLRLEAGQPGSLTPTPRSLGMGPERHQGYAFQWFALAATLLTAYVVYGVIQARRA